MKRSRVRQPARWQLDPAADRARVRRPRRRGRMSCSTASASCTNPTSGRLRAARAADRSPGGVLLLQYHSIATIVEQGQWNALRHGHFAYYSLTTLTHLLEAVGMRVAAAWEFDLYGGTVLLAAVHGRVEPDESVRRILAAESRIGHHPRRLRATLQRDADEHARFDAELAAKTEAAQAERSSLTAPPRARSRCSAAPGSMPDCSRRSADASPAKQGRRMPGTDIPIISPDELLAAKPDRVLSHAARSVARGQRRHARSSTGRWKVDGEISLKSRRKVGNPMTTILFNADLHR